MLMELKKKLCEEQNHLSLDLQPWDNVIAEDIDLV